MQYVKEIIENLRCPLDWQNCSGKELFLQKWYYTVSDIMPNQALDAASLKPAWQAECLQQPCEQFLLEELDERELESLHYNSEKFKQECRAQYQAECAKFSRFYAQPADERSKHYALLAKNLDDVIRQSKAKPDIGLLLPNLLPRVQIEFYWQAMTNIFEQLQFEYEERNERASEREVFDFAWQQLMTVEQFRISVDALTTVGYFAGKPAKWLIYDTTLSGNVVHCYPALEGLSNGHHATISYLKGLEQAYIEQRTDWP